MPRVYVQFAGMKQLDDSWTSVASQLSEIQGSFSSTVKNLDWDIQCQSDIRAAASRLSGSLENYQQALKSYQSFFQQAYDSYQKLDQNQEGQDDLKTLSTGVAVVKLTPWTAVKTVATIIQLLITIHEVGNANNQNYPNANGLVAQWGLALKNFFDILFITAAKSLGLDDLLEPLEELYQDYLNRFSEYMNGGDLNSLKLAGQKLLEGIYALADSNPVLKPILNALKEAWEQFTGETITDWSAGVIDDQASSGLLGWIGQGVETLGDVISDGLDFVNDLWNHLFNGG